CTTSPALTPPLRRCCATGIAPASPTSSCASPCSICSARKRPAAPRSSSLNRSRWPRSSERLSLTYFSVQEEGELPSSLHVGAEVPLMLPRVLEPEVMDSPEEARDYDAMEHAAVNRVFVDDFLKLWDGGQPLLDVG